MTGKQKQDSISFVSKYICNHLMSTLFVTGGIVVAAKHFLYDRPRNLERRAKNDRLILKYKGVLNDYANYVLKKTKMDGNTKIFPPSEIDYKFRLGFVERGIKLIDNDNFYKPIGAAFAVTMGLLIDDDLRQGLYDFFGSIGNSSYED